MANNNQADDFGYSKMSVEQLNKLVTDMVNSNADLKDKKKEYNSATNEVIKENNKKIEMALEARKLAQQKLDDQAHEVSVGEFLKNQEK